MLFRVYCAHITPIMFNNLSSYNLDELVKPLPFLIDSSDENEACYSAIKKLVDDCSDDIYEAGIDNIQGQRRPLPAWLWSFRCSAS